VLGRSPIHYRGCPGHLHSRNKYGRTVKRFKNLKLCSSIKSGITHRSEKSEEIDSWSTVYLSNHKIEMLSIVRSSHSSVNSVMLLFGQKHIRVTFTALKQSLDSSYTPLQCIKLLSAVPFLPRSDTNTNVLLGTATRLTLEVSQ